MYLIDAHQDLAYNVLNFGRSYYRSAAETRLYEREIKSSTPTHNGNTLLGWQDYMQARTAVIFSTLYASPERYRMGSWNKLYYRNFEEAHQLYQDQLDVYHRWADERPEKFRLIMTKQNLAEIIRPWEDPQDQGDHPIGLVILMEGAEGVRTPEELESWWARGVRIIGPAWAGTRYCGGTGEPGPLTNAGFELLESMHEFGFVLDLSHMDEQSALQALDHYPGAVIASHANALALIKGNESNRHLSDRVIQGILERDGTIGLVPYNTFLKTGWKIGDRRSDVTLHDFVAQIDYICQMAGNAQHVGIGSDFDGGFGVESVPAGIETIADLHEITPILNEHGYSDDDIAAIFGVNWQRMLACTLPE